MKCIIVDDEFPAREELKYFISKDTNMELLKEFESSMDAFNYLQENSTEVDILFLDIDMSEINGLNLARIIQKINPNLKIVFVTAYPNYAVDAFEIRALDYLLKPYSEQRIEKLLDRLNGEVKRPKLDKISIPVGDKIIILSIDDIAVVEADKKGTRVYTKEVCYLSKMKISDWEEILDREKFYRCHRSYIIQLAKVRELETWFNNSYLAHIEDCKVAVPISRNNIKEFKTLFYVK